MNKHAGEAESLSSDAHRDGMAVRRRVLGDDYVDQSIARSGGFSAEVQDLIVRYGWGEIWTRPGLDIHSRRMLIIATTLALGRWEVFRLHVRAALADGFPLDELREIVLQQIIYCGIPLGNVASQHIEEIISELQANGVAIAGTVVL